MCSVVRAAGAAVGADWDWGLISAVGTWVEGRKILIPGYRVAMGEKHPSHTNQTNHQVILDGIKEKSSTENGKGQRGKKSQTKKE